MAKYSSAEPTTSVNEAAFEITQMQLQQAVELARTQGQRDDLVPALLVALAINKHSETLRKVSK